VGEDLFDVMARDQGEGDEAADAAATKATVRLRVHVRPGAGRSAVVGRHGDALAVRVAAPPVDGRANEACATLLREELDVPALELVGGEKGPDKRFEIRDVDVEVLRRRLDDLLEEAGVHRGAGRANRSHRR
jgi:uncharacterized protein (TIGR00251 family)